MGAWISRFCRKAPLWQKSAASSSTAPWQGSSRETAASGARPEKAQRQIGDIKPQHNAKRKGPEDAIFVLAYDSEVLNHLRALDRPAQNLVQAALLSFGVDLSRRKAEMLSALELLRRSMHKCPASATAQNIGLS